MPLSVIDNIQKLVRLFDDSLDGNHCCRSLYCSTCGGVYHAIKSKMTGGTKLLLHSVMGQISSKELSYFGFYTPLTQALEPKAYKQIIRNEIHEIDHDDIREVDYYLIEARHNYSLSDEVFQQLIDKAVEMTISTENKSLCETLVIVLKNEVVKYSRIVDLALDIAKTDKQMQRVLFNCVRESVHEVRKYSNEAVGFYCAGDVFPTIHTTKELSQMAQEYKNNLTDL